MKIPANLRPLSDIPNAAGFLLILVREDGCRQVSRVAKDPVTGRHYCETPSGRKVDFTGKSDERSPVIGWEERKTAPVYEIPGMKPNSAPHLVTREQCARLLVDWKVEEKPPAKGAAVMVNFPGSVLGDLPQAMVRITQHLPEEGQSGKSTDGKTLFSLQFYVKV